ncbi:MAG: amino acid permease [Armatimonadota bacterium]
MDNEASPPRLSRILSLLDAVAIGLGAMIGAGIFVVISVAVNVAGGGVIISFAIGTIAAIFPALSTARLAAAYPVSGATSFYAAHLLGRPYGFVAGWIFIFATISADAAVVLAFGSYLHFLIPDIPLRATSITFAVIVTTINYFGIRLSANVIDILVIVKLAVLLFFIAVGAFFFRVERVFPMMLHGVMGAIEGAAIVFFAYAGFARIAVIGEEVRDPIRTIPKAILLALGTATILYLTVALVALGLLGVRGLAGASAPLSAAIRKTPLDIGPYIISIGALTSIFTVFLTDMLGVSRMFFALARSRELPDWLSHVHEKYGTPHLAILLNGALVAVLALIANLHSVVKVASFGMLAYYGLTCLAALRLPSTGGRYHRACDVAGIISCFALASFLSLHVILLGLLVIAFGIVYFFTRNVFSSDGGPSDAHV